MKVNKKITLNPKLSPFSSKNARFNRGTIKVDDVVIPQKRRALSPSAPESPLIKMMQNYTIRYLDKILTPKNEPLHGVSTFTEPQLPEINFHKRQQINKGLLSPKRHFRSSLVSHESPFSRKIRSNRLNQNLSEFVTDEDLARFREQILSDYLVAK